MNLKQSELQLVFVISFYCSTVGAAEDGKSVFCFHEIDTVGMRDQTRFNLKNFDVKLCTHLVYGTIRLDLETNQVKYSDILNEGGKNGNLIAELKLKNPKLKIMVILNLDQYFWTEIHTEILTNTSHVDETARKVVDVLEQHMFDGVYFEHFFSHDAKSGIVSLMRSLKKAFGPKRFILAYVGNSNEEELDQGNDIAELSKNVDMLILETCNFHDATFEPKWADHHAPLYNRPWDQENKTVDSLVSQWISKGFPANKILLTIPLWGNSWKLSSNETSPPAPANGKGAPGRLTSRRGFMGYFEICENIHKNEWQVFQYDNKTMGPYAVSPSDTSQNQIWVGYDDPAMAVIKSEYIKTRGLGGAAVKDICYDDIDDRCDGGKYPILSAIEKTLSSRGSTELLIDHTETIWIIIPLLGSLVLLSVLVGLLVVVCKRKLEKRRENIQQVKSEISLLETDVRDNRAAGSRSTHSFISMIAKKLNNIRNFFCTVYQQMSPF